MDRLPLMHRPCRRSGHECQLRARRQTNIAKSKGYVNEVPFHAAKFPLWKFSLEGTQMNFFSSGDIPCHLHGRHDAGSTIGACSRSHPSAPNRKSVWAHRAICWPWNVSISTS